MPCVCLALGREEQAGPLATGHAPSWTAMTKSRSTCGAGTDRVAQVQRGDESQGSAHAHQAAACLLGAHGGTKDIKMKSP